MLRTIMLKVLHQRILLKPKILILTIKVSFSIQIRALFVPITNAISIPNPMIKEVIHKFNSINGRLIKLLP